MTLPLDITGQVFGKLTVIGPKEEIRPGYYKWRCLCECTREQWVHLGNLMSGHIRACGCQRQGKPYEGIYKRLLRGCKDRNKECAISYEAFVVFTSEEKCHYCWTPLVWTKTNVFKTGVGYNLDRKDNALTYTVSNCVACCGRCNRGKGSSYTYKEWWQMTAIYRRTEQMSNFQIGDVVVHRSLGSQPLVITRIVLDEQFNPHTVYVRYGTQGRDGVFFTEYAFTVEELETPVESIEREAEIFKALNTKKNEVNEELRRSEPVGPSGIGHLN